MLVLKLSVYQVTELATVKRPQERAYALQRWHEDGGIMIIGYEMYRNLTQGRNIKSKKLKETFQKTLVNPGEVQSVITFNSQHGSLWACFDEGIVIAGFVLYVTSLCAFFAKKRQISGASHYFIINV